MIRAWVLTWVLLIALVVPPVLAQTDSPSADEVAGDDDDSAQQEPDPEPPPPPPVAAGLGLTELLVRFGEEPPAHWMEPDAEQIRMGREIVTEGRTVGPDGKLSRKSSPGYVCTDCHNVVREDPDLRSADPEARLAYAVEQDLPFLPGTTLWGTVDRVSWFNEDYVKKYGELVQPANRSLRMAILLCSAECSQGRVLEDWELDAVTAYLWSIGVTYGDLDLDDEQRRTVELAAAGHADQNGAAAAILRDAFLAWSPAHVREPPADREVGYGNTGDPERGAEVWRRSCLTCHAAPVIGTAPFKDNRGTVAHLWRERAEAGKGGLYQTLSYGTRPYSVPLVYMPFYTQERLSEQQADDLRAYFAQVLGEEVK